VLALGGLGYLSHSFYLLLLRVTGPWQAGLTIGLGLLLLASALIVIAHHLAGRNHRARVRTTGIVNADPAADLGHAMGQLLSRSDVRTTDLLLASLVAGIVFGASPRLREGVSRIGRSRSGPTRPSAEHESGSEARNGRHGA